MRSVSSPPDGCKLDITKEIQSEEEQGTLILVSNASNADGVVTTWGEKPLFLGLKGNSDYSK